jgi:hypothetical protein
MGRIQQFIEYLQSRSEGTRNKILWGASTVATVLVVFIWGTNLNHQLRSISGVSTTTTAPSQISAPHYIAIESAETSNGKLNIYFSVKNDTSDILNFSQNSDIVLSVGNKTFKPKSVVTRQNQKFIQKALSKTQSFGILTFENVAGTSGQLSFDNLFFEQNPQNLFKEVLPVDLKKLNQTPSIRN